jgi:hypothetical protein
MKAVSTKLPARLIGLLVLGTTAYAQSLSWPLKGDIDLSSGYGDYRSGGRFHVGLDLRTGGQIGAKVYSPVDGYVWRVRMSYGGYGKGLYLKGNDGYIYVFGHLSGFNETIQSAVVNEQFRRERYFVDLQFPADSVPVKAGQLIAYSGETGAGGPHLHFEKRTGDNIPLDPRSHGFRLDDKTSPTFERLGIHLLGDRSLFSDGLRKMFLPVKRIGAGQYQVTQAVTLSAPFGLLLDCFDLMRPDGRRQAVYKLTLTIDDSLYYESTLDSLSYDIGPIVDLVYEPTQAADGDQRVRRTYRPVAGDRIWSAARESYGGKGTGRCAYGLDITPVFGEHRAVIAAEDVFGNRSELVFRFNYVEAGSTKALSRQCDYAVVDGTAPTITDWRVDEDGLVTKTKTGNSSRYYFFRPRPPSETRPGDEERLFERQRTQLLAKGVELQVAGWNGGRLISVDSGAFAVVLPPGAFFAPQFLTVSTIVVRGAPGAIAVSKAYQVMPEAVAMREKFEVSIRLAADHLRNRQTGLCRFDRSGKTWTWIDNDTTPSDKTSGSSAGGGVFAAMVDTTAPTISGLNLSQRHTYYDRQPVVKFKLRDNLSGFEDDCSIDVRVDGRWLLPEFDIEEGRCVATLGEPLDLGPHELKITAVDRAGNRCERKTEFEIVKRGKKK